MNEKYLIELCGNRYEVKIKNGKRMILSGTDWMEATAFVDMLISIGRWEEVAELVKLGGSMLKQ